MLSILAQAVGVIADKPGEDDGALQLVECRDGASLAEMPLRQQHKRAALDAMEERLPDDRRQLAVMHALVRFANIAAGSQFRTKALRGHVAEALGMTTEKYTLDSLRCDLSKIRAKGLVKKVELPDATV